VYFVKQMKTISHLFFTCKGLAKFVIYVMYG